MVPFLKHLGERVCDSGVVFVISALRAVHVIETNFGNEYSSDPLGDEEYVTAISGRPHSPRRASSCLVPFSVGLIAPLPCPGVASGSITDSFLFATDPSQLEPPLTQRDDLRTAIMTHDATPPSISSQSPSSHPIPFLTSPVG